MFCRKCAAELAPSTQMLKSDDPYYAGAARCGSCGYLYFPEFPGTWNTEAWMTDFDHKKSAILEWDLVRLTGWRQDAYLLLHFVNCLESMFTWYLDSPEFGWHDRLAVILNSVGAVKSVETLRELVSFANHPDQLAQRVGLTRDQNDDDAWDYLTAELEENLDADLRQLIYNRYMRDREPSDFANNGSRE